MNESMKPVDDIIHNELLPAIIGERISEEERKLYSLPVRSGELGIPIFTEKICNDLENSSTITAPLVAIIITQGIVLPDSGDVEEATSIVSQRKIQQLHEKALVVEENLNPQTKRAVCQAKQKGASNWLTVLPIEQHGFTLTKNEFRDAIQLRYNKDLKGMPSKCPCGQKYDVTHAMNCKKGGFVIMRHNNVRDFEANLLKTVVNDVEIEPPLQKLENEEINGLTGDDAKPDIRARGVWRKGQNAFFDIRLTNVNANSQKHLPVNAILKKHEQEKKRSYNNRIMNVEHGTFTPLVFSLTGGEGPETSMFHKHISQQIAIKTEEKYEKVRLLIRCKI